MKILLIAAVLALSLAGCVVYPARSTVTYSDGYSTSGTEVYYDDRAYFYDPYYVGPTVRLYYYAGGQRHYRYAPRDHFHGHPTSHGHYYSHH